MNIVIIEVACHTNVTIVKGGKENHDSKRFLREEPTKKKRPDRVAFFVFFFFRNIKKKEPSVRVEEREKG